MKRVNDAIVAVVDETDKEIMLAIMNGHTSPYSIWSALNKQAQGRGMAYINIKKRVQRLSETRLLERLVNQGTTNNNARDRKDYKVSMKGFSYVMPHIIATVDFADQYLRSVVGKHHEAFPLDYAEQIALLQRRTIELNLRLKEIQSSIIARSPPQIAQEGKLLRQRERIDPKSGRRTRTSELVVVEPVVSTVFAEDQQQQIVPTNKSKSVVSQRKKH